jgi:hypothetical protein
MDHGFNPAYVEAVVKRAQAINPKIPNEAVPFYGSRDCDHYEDLDFSGGIMSSEEVEGCLESARNEVKLPNGFMCIGLEHGSARYFVVMDMSGIPSPHTPEQLAAEGA